MVIQCIENPRQPVVSAGQSKEIIAISGCQDFSFPPKFASKHEIILLYMHNKHATSNKAKCKRLEGVESILVLSHITTLFEYSWNAVRHDFNVLINSTLTQSTPLFLNNSPKLLPR